MPQASWMQTTFSGGEWSPYYQGRADHPRYKTALNVCYNGLPMEEGAWVRRPGSRLKSTTYKAQKGRVYPVEFTENEPYQVEFTDGAVRFFQGHQLVFTTDGTKTVSAVTTANPAVMTLSSAVTWASDDEVMFFFDSGHASGALPLRQRVIKITKLTTTTFSLKDAISGANINGSTLSMPAGATVTVKRILRLSSPYTSGSWDNIRIVQNQDMGVVLCPTVTPYALTITAGTTAGTADAALAAITFKDGPYFDPISDSSNTDSVLYWTGGTYSGPKRWGIDGSSANQGEVWTFNPDHCQSWPTFQAWVYMVYTARATASGGGGAISSTTSHSPGDGNGGDEGWAPVDPGGVQAGVTGTITVTAGFRQWESTVTYEVDNYVNNGTTTSYHCIAQNTNVEPGVAGGWATYWEVVDSGLAVTGPGNSPVGFQATDVGRMIRFWSQPANWDPTLVYGNGTAVTYQDAPYAATGVSIFRPPRAGINPQTSFTEPAWGELTFDTFGNAQTGTPDYYGTTSTWYPGFAPIGLTGQWSWGVITQVNSTSQAVIQIDPDSAPIVDPLNTPPLQHFRMGLWSATTSYPTCGSFYESRFWFGGAQPNRFDTTQTDGWSAGSTIVQMGPTITSGDQSSGFVSDGTVTDACGISYTFESKDTNQIVWMEPDHNGLMCGTLGGEWLIAASNLSDPITPTSIQAKRVTKYGCANIEPRRTGLSLVFVQKFKHRVMEFLSDVFSGRYTAPHLNEAAKHLAKFGVEELGYQEELAPVLWARTGAAQSGVNTGTVINAAGYDMTGWVLDDSWSGHPATSPPIGDQQLAGLVTINGYLPPLGLYNTVKVGTRNIGGVLTTVSWVVFGADPHTDNWLGTGATNWAGVAELWYHIGIVAAPQFASGSGVTPTTTSDGSLIGATYRRTSAFTTESPAIIGWHHHELGHARALHSIGVTPSPDGLLDNLDMVTTNGSNYYVEGLTQIFDEDDELQDAWYMDGALVPDSAYEDTVSSVTGIRFTGLWYLIGATVSAFCVGLDLGDFTVDANGTIFVPYGSGTQPASFNYASAGAGAYLFTPAYIAGALQTNDVRNGGVPYSGKYMPCCIGYNFTSEGQSLRPISPQDSGARTGPALGDIRRSHYVQAILHNTLGIEFGTDFSKMRASELKDGTGAQPTPTEPYSGVWRETLEDDYSFDSMVAWRIKRPYPASVVSIGASVQTQDA